VTPLVEAGAIFLSNGDELTYLFNAERWRRRQSARKSQIFAMNSRSARSLSVETVCAVSRHFSASRRYSSGLFLSVIEFYWFLPSDVLVRYAACLATQLVRQAPTNVAQRL